MGLYLRYLRAPVPFDQAKAWARRFVWGAAIAGLIWGIGGVIMFVLLLSGFMAYTSLPKESFPAIDIPYFYVSTSQTGVSPRDAERLLAKPIEDRVKDLDGLENYTSTSSTGHASVFLEFNVNADKDKALADIRAKLDGVASELPDDATTPTVTAPTPAPTPAASDVPFARSVAGKPGYVYSPKDPKKIISVDGLRPGSKAKDPETGEIFRVPFQ